MSLLPELDDGAPPPGHLRLVGTLAYASPESLAGEPPAPSFDLWSLPVVLYECLLGRRLFTGPEPSRVAARIRSGRVPDLQQLVPGSDPALAAFFRTALHRVPALRPASAADLRRRLQAVRSRLNRESEAGAAG
jgi:eukaryotic-like serine/threonine-protein kinase